MKRPLSHLEMSASYFDFLMGHPSRPLRVPTVAEAAAEIEDEPMTEEERRKCRAAVAGRKYADEHGIKDPPPEEHYSWRDLMPED